MEVPNQRDWLMCILVFLQCTLDHIYEQDSISGVLCSFFSTVHELFVYLLERSTVSLGGAMILLTLAVTFVPSKLTWKKRVFIGTLHFSAHLASALMLLLLMELGVETCIRHKLLGNAGKCLSFLSVSRFF